jgi:hypothetical protein
MLAVLQSRTTRERLYNAIIFAIFVVFWTFFLKFLWNQTLVPHITVFKPVSSLVDTFLLAVGLAAFRL